MFKKNSSNIFILAILFFGIIFRFYNINYDDLWYDEIISFYVANPDFSLKESHNIHKDIEIAPFTFNLILKIFYQIFGYDVHFARYIPAFFSVLTIITVIKISKILNNDKSFIFSAFLISFNIFLINYAQEQRLYSLLIFFSSLSFLYFLKLIENKVENINFFIFFTSTIILVFLHIFSLFIIFSYVIYLALLFLKNKIYYKILNRYIFFISLLVVVFYLPYVMNFSQNLNFNLDVNYSWNKNPDLKFFTNFYFSNFFGSRILGLIHLLFFICLLYRFRRNLINLEKNFLIFIIVLFSYLIPILFGYIFKPILLPRYISYVVFFIIILITSFIFKIESKKIKYSAVAFLILVTLGNMFTEQAFKQFGHQRVKGKPEYTQAINFIHDSGYINYSLKIEKMKSNYATTNAINSYISHLSKKKDLRLKYNNLFEIPEEPIWILCPMDINEKTCALPKKVKSFEISKEKYFNSINLKLIRRN